MDQRFQPGRKGGRILVVKLSSLGDLFHALPAVHRLKAGLEADIDWVTQNEYSELVGCFTDVSRVIGFPRRGTGADWANFWRAVRREEYRAVVDFQGLLKSALATCLARAPYRLGPSFHREGSRWFYTETAGPTDRTRHAVDECLDAVRWLGLSAGPVEFPVRFPSVLAGTGGPRVAMVPMSRWPSKNWPVSRFGELARRLVDRGGAVIHLMGGGGAEARAACAAIAEGLPAGGVVNLAGRTRLVEMGGWLQAMDLVIGNDSGPLHMAAAVGTPVLAFFGPTDPVRSGPYGEGHRILQVSADRCRNCRRRNCRRGDGACLAALTVDEAMEAATRLLKAKGYG